MERIDKLEKLLMIKEAIRNLVIHNGAEAIDDKSQKFILE